MTPKIDRLHTSPFEDGLFSFDSGGWNQKFPLTSVYIFIEFKFLDSPKSIKTTQKFVSSLICSSGAPKMY